MSVLFPDNFDVFLPGCNFRLCGVRHESVETTKIQAVLWNIHLRPFEKNFIFFKKGLAIIRSSSIIIFVGRQESLKKALNRLKQLNMRLWRNWQTRTVQVRVMNSHEGSNPSNRTNGKSRNHLVSGFCIIIFSYESLPDDR